MAQSTGLIRVKAGQVLNAGQLVPYFPFEVLTP
ncbi:MAG: hypothetical protein HC848_05935 [Limnobacter sp.]|nr:hypothetical protein [Limnobacter sp.]